MRRTPPYGYATMTWIIHFTDGETFEQDRDYPADRATLFEKRRKIIDECIYIYGHNLSYIEFEVWTGTTLDNLAKYRHNQ